MKSVIQSSRTAIKNLEDYEARSNIMWTAAWALNTLVSRGKDTDWMVHMLGQSVGAYTNATHGMTLSAVTLPYYRKSVKKHFFIVTIRGDIESLLCKIAPHS